MELRTVNPRDIFVPPIRVNSNLPEELQESFQASIRDTGIQQPPLVFEEGGRLVCVDGRHRVEAAILAGAESIDVVVRPGDLREVLVKNLATTRLQGKPKASEVRKVIAHLEQEYSMGSDEIRKETGLTRDYIERLMWINRGFEELQLALDEDKISVGHAYTIARLEPTDLGRTILSQQLTFHWTLAQLNDHLTRVNEIIANPPPPPPENGQHERNQTECYFCGRVHPVHDLVYRPMCFECYGVLQAAFRQTAAPATSPGGL